MERIVKAKPLIIVLCTVLLNILSAVLLKETSSIDNGSFLLIVMVLFLVVFLNALRFLFWRVLHKNHPISLTYPMSSIFFPIIMIVGYARYGESVTVNNLVGAALITIGVGLLSMLETANTSNQRAG